MNPTSKCVWNLLNQTYIFHRTPAFALLSERHPITYHISIPQAKLTVILYSVFTLSCIANRTPWVYCSWASYYFRSMLIAGCVSWTGGKDLQRLRPAVLHFKTSHDISLQPPSLDWYFQPPGFCAFRTEGYFRDRPTHRTPPGILARKYWWDRQSLPTVGRPRIHQTNRLRPLNDHNRFPQFQELLRAKSPGHTIDEISWKSRPELSS